MGTTSISAPKASPYIDLERTFEAPVELLYRAHTDPELLKQWLGPDRYAMTVEEYRENGHIWMIKIVQPNGPTQTFMDNDGSGRLMRDPREGPVSPVYYTLYEWK